MPRPNRAQGRPGTRVIPKDWNESHAEVVRKTWTAECTITPPSSGGVTVDSDLNVTTGAPAAAAYTGGCRVQQLNAKETVELIADQKITGAAYLVVIDREADIDLYSTAAITAADDSTLPVRRMTVVKVGRGSEHWERDLYCVEDQTAPKPT